MTGFLKFRQFLLLEWKIDSIRIIKNDKYLDPGLKEWTKDLSMIFNVIFWTWLSSILSNPNWPYLSTSINMTKLYRWIHSNSIKWILFISIQTWPPFFTSLIWQMKKNVKMQIAKINKMPLIWIRGCQPALVEIWPE